MAAETRLNVLKSFQSNGLLLDKEALSILSEFVLSVGGNQQDIMQLVEACQAGKAAASINPSLWNGPKVNLALRSTRARAIDLKSLILY